MYYIVILPTYVVYSREVDWTNASSKMLHTSQSVPFLSKCQNISPISVVIFCWRWGMVKISKKVNLIIIQNMVKLLKKKPTQGSRIHSVKITVDFVKTTFTA